jgi:arylsulfatase A-like enzyme
MNFHLNRRLYFVLILSAILLNQCKRNIDSHRFVDILDSNNIISSPLKNLDLQFTKIEHHWLGKDMILMKGGKTETWGITSKSLLLGWDDQRMPESMEVSQNGSTIEFFPLDQTEKTSWRWKRIEEFIEPERYRGYKRFKGAVLLPKGKYFVSRELILPQGEVTFEITASSQSGMKNLPLLELYLNDELIGEIPIFIYKNYKFIHSIDSGTYTLKIGFSKVLLQSPNNKETDLLLDQIKITSSKDLILISSPRIGESQKESAYRAVYPIQPEKKIIYPEEFNPIKELGNSTKVSAEKPLQKTVDLETGENSFEIIGFTKEKGTFLKVWLDKNHIGTKRLQSWRWDSFRFGANVKEGRYTLKIEWINPKKNSGGTQGEFFIHRVIWYKPAINTSLPLHKMKSSYPIYDLGIDENPLSIKKKLEIGEHSINALFSPPKSEYRFNIKMPQSGILQFGYGLMAEEWKSDKAGVLFKIILEEAGNKHNLFSKYLALSSIETGKEIFEEKIDLSKFAGKKTAISFITEEASSDNNNQIENVDGYSPLSFWFNPFLYKKRDPGDKGSGNKPNIILISIDTLRADHLSCYGYERETTPSTDTLSQDSVLFTHAYSPSPSTLPSHMSMLTSLYPTNHGLVTMPLGGPQGDVLRLDPAIMTLSDLMRTKDYVTAAFTGGAQISSQFGFSKGFDFYQENKGSILKDTAENLTEKVSEWLLTNQDKKFFLFLHTYQVHAPYIPPSPYNDIFLNNNAKWRKADLIEILSSRQGKYSRLTPDERENLVALYDGEIKYTDELFIRPLISQLKKLGLYDQSMIILTADHGEEFYEHKGWEHGHSLYNENIHVPLIIKFPHSKHRGKKVESTARLIDILPTILEEVGIKKKNLNFDGRDLSELIDGKEKSSRLSVGFNFYAEYADPTDMTLRFSLLKLTIINNHFKLIINEDYPKNSSQPVFWTYSPPPFQLSKRELYDIKTDFQETKNTAEANPDTVRLLMDSVDLHRQAADQISRQTFRGRQGLDKKMEERLRALGYIK